MLTSAIRSAGLQTEGAALNEDVEAYRAAVQHLVAAEGRFAQGELASADRALLDKAVALRTQAVPVAEDALKFTMAFAGDEAAKLLSGKFTQFEHPWSAHLVELAKLQRATLSPPLGSTMPRLIDRPRPVLSLWRVTMCWNSAACSARPEALPHPWITAWRASMSAVPGRSVLPSGRAWIASNSRFNSTCGSAWRLMARAWAWPPNSRRLVRMRRSARPSTNPFDQSAVALRLWPDDQAVKTSRGYQALD